MILHNTCNGNWLLCMALQDAAAGCSTDLWSLNVSYEVSYIITGFPCLDLFSDNDRQTILNYHKILNLLTVEINVS